MNDKELMEKVVYKLIPIIRKELCDKCERPLLVYSQKQRKAIIEEANLRNRANLTLLVAGILDCKTIEETKPLLSSWITAHKLKPNEVKAFTSMDKLIAKLHIRKRH